MNIRWRVELSQDEREELTALLKSGRHAVRKVKRAQILLAADDGLRWASPPPPLKISARGWTRVRATACCTAR